MKTSFFWKIYPQLLVLPGFVLVAVLAFSFYTFKDFYYEKTREDLRSRAEMVLVSLEENQIQEAFFVPSQEENLSRLQSIVLEIKNKTSTRVTVIGHSGVVLADSDKNPKLMDNHKERPEVQGALQGEATHSIRYSQTLEQNQVYVAIPFRVRGTVAGVIRASVSLEQVKTVLDKILLEMILGGLALLLLTALSSWWISHNVSMPLSKIKERITEIAQGNFKESWDHQKFSIQEFEQLGQSINQVAVDLDRRIQTVLAQKNEQVAVLSSMIEGVLVVDRKGTVRQINQAASKILGLWPEFSIEEAQGLSIEEAVRIPELQKVIRDSMKGEIALEQEVEINDGDRQFLQIHASPLRTKTRDLGVVYVFNDVTQIRNLEAHRKDFVANVSHELRTPLTSIQGFAETLMNPAVGDVEKQDFLNIIAQQAGRLSAIIDDLLALSRLEKDHEQREMELVDGNLEPVIQSAMNACRIKAKQKGIRMEVRGTTNLRLKMNAPLVEQALVNLLDNAIKYSNGTGKEVRLEVVQEEGSVRVQVVDQGVGIAQEHLPRLFERFYRVDKARSRSMGGTGLGLSIVKHIAIAHGGDVHVESQPGRGSRFTMVFPLIPNH